MPVDAATVEQVRAMLPTADSGDLAVLETIPEVLGYIVAYARSEGADELELTELVARAADLSRNERRSAATVLRKLGYRAVADMLRTFKK